MLGPVLICGVSKETRLAKAWEVLVLHGFVHQKASPNLLIVQKEPEKKSIGIAQARKVKGFMHEKPFSGKVKAVLVEESQHLTHEAQNSLLAILEEPPDFALILLLSSKEGALLPTVVSRCQRIVLRESPGTTRLSDSPVSLDKSYGELFDFAKELSQKTKDEVLMWLEDLLATDLRQPVTPRTLELVTKTKKVIDELKDANVAVNFALEYVLLLHKLAL